MTDYIEYGKKWEKEMMKWRKKDLIARLRKLLKEKNRKWICDLPEAEERQDNDKEKKTNL